MKIICISGNSGDGADLSRYNLPDSTVIKSGKPFFLPEPENGYEALLSVAIRIDRLGKSIREKFASRYYSMAAPVVNVVNRPLLDELRGKGLPWDEAVAFDGSCWLGDFIECASLLHDGSSLRMYSGEDEVAVWRPESLAMRVDRLIERVSIVNTLKTGDIVVFGFPPAGYRLKIGDSLLVKGDDNKELMRIRVR